MCQRKRSRSRASVSFKDLPRLPKAFAMQFNALRPDICLAPCLIHATLPERLPAMLELHFAFCSPLQSLNQESLVRFPPPKMALGYTRKWAQPPRSPWSLWRAWRAWLAACSMPLHKEDMWRYNRWIFF